MALGLGLLKNLTLFMTITSNQLNGASAPPTKRHLEQGVDYEQANG